MSIKKIVLSAAAVMSALTLTLITAVGCVGNAGGNNDENTVGNESDTENNSSEGGNNAPEGSAKPDGNDGENDEATEADTMTVTINGVTFEAELADTAAAEVFYSLLPMELNMSELNGNEKYHYLDESLPSDAERPQVITSGDIMLYGSSCVVIFYKTFTTSYTYTRLGKIINADSLESTVGNGSVEVVFSK